MIPCSFESPTQSRGKRNRTQNFPKFLFLPDMVREEETSTAGTRAEETTLEGVDEWLQLERRTCPVQRSLVTGPNSSTETPRLYHVVVGLVGE